MADIPGNNTTTSTIGVGGVISNQLEVLGDHDWFKITLTAGQSISVALDGITLEDPYLRIRDANGNIIYENDDISSGVNRDSLLAFTATYSGTYYIDVGAWDEGYAGTYQLSVSPYSPPPLGTIQEMAEQLTSGFWGGETQHFNVTQGGNITVNLTGLTAAGQALAIAALATWTDIIGVNFTQVASGGQIIFDDDEEGAFSDSIVSGGFITSSQVNVSTGWLTQYGTGQNTYSFQTYIHEIGHALGLGHQGNYNGDARYPYDASFQNDSWAMSVMSYFSQTDNTYFAGQGFEENLLTTPMMADILAMSMLYGLSTVTRTGNSVYGPSWTSEMGALCIFDSGGTDTIDCSSLNGGHLINLGAGTFSDIMGETGNVSIALGVTIENAVGGSNSDLILGNSANNILDGRDGFDTVSYATAAAAVTVNLGLATPQNTVGAGTDTLLNFESLTGSRFNDTLVGKAGGTVNGGDGNDLIQGVGGGSLNGQNGNDIFIPSGGIMDGGAGWDTVNLSSAGSAVTVDLANQGPNSHGLFYSVEQAIGSAFHDRLSGTKAANILTGLAGADVLTGAGGADTFLDTAAGLNGDTITDFGTGDKIIITNASLAEFGFSLSGNTLTYTGGSLTLTGFSGQLAASAAAGGGVQLTVVPADVRNDFNGDGFSDVLWRNDDGRLISWLGADGSFGSNANGNYAVSTSWKVAGTGDFNGDGRDDVLWRNDDGRMISWLGRADGSFGSNPNGNLTVSTSWKIAGTGDFNGDGRDDVLWRNDDGRVISWLGRADGSFGSNPNGNYAVSTNWNVGGTGDFNGDGRADILWRNDDGRLISWLGRADGSFGSNPNGNYTIPNSWHIAGVGDFNGDNYDDILWRNDDGRLIDWLGRADGHFDGNPNGNAQIGAEMQIAGIGDFNGDGSDDILWRNDVGRVTGWLGESDAAFYTNPAVNQDVPNAWHVQSPDLLI